jgi:hypothetical protein
MLQLLPRDLSKLNLGALALEIIVVILGILIAFQIDRWAGERREHEQELAYLLRLQDDLKIEMSGMDAALQIAEARISDVMILEKALDDSSVTREQPGNVVTAVEKATWRSFPQINAFVYSELQNTGNLGLIRSDRLRRELASHYSSIRHYERVGLDLTIQQHFDRLTAGILTTTELLEIERGAWSGTPSEVTVERALEVVQELASREDAGALLPNIAQHHVFNHKVVETARSRTQEIIELIDSQIVNFEH